jgi:hypothetical protein
MAANDDTVKVFAALTIDQTIPLPWGPSGPIVSAYGVQSVDVDTFGNYIVTTTNSADASELFFTGKSYGGRQSGPNTFELQPGAPVFTFVLLRVAPGLGLPPFTGSPPS